MKTAGFPSPPAWARGFKKFLYGLTRGPDERRALRGRVD